MPRETFEIRFDRHGHVVVDDPELERRLLYLLRHDQQLVVRLRSGQAQGVPLVPPNLRCPPPDPMPILNRICPNVMCDACLNGIKVVDDVAFQRQWSELRNETRPGLGLEPGT